MKFNSKIAKLDYEEMFGAQLDDEIIAIARKMTDAEFEQAQEQFDADGEYIDSPFSAGQWDCIDGAR